MGALAIFVAQILRPRGNPWANPGLSVEC